MTARGPRRHRLARTLAAVALAAVALVSPLESGLLPGPAGGLAGSAAAQEPRSFDGVPADCPTTRSPTEIKYQPDTGDDSLCVLMLWSCPASPLVNPTGLMRLSVAPESVVQLLFEFGHDPGDITYSDEGLVRYPEFCEERVRQSESPTDYDACTSLTGYAILDDGELCRILAPIACVAGLHQDRSRTCRAVQRRSWTCGARYRPGNKFPICFRLIEINEGDPSPACRRGGPDLGVFAADEDACRRYVAEDWLQSPQDQKCRDYTTGRALPAGIPQMRMSNNPSRNRHWCQFDRMRLTLDCQLDSSGPCQPQPALCLKRASRTGGCDQVVETVRCRAHQFAYRRAHDRYLNASPRQRTQREEARNAARDAARDAGCAPCVTLPFEGPSCDDEELQAPDRAALTRSSSANLLWPGYSRAIRILECGVDLQTDPLTQNPPCTPAAAGHCIDAPSGSLEWVSNHFSGLAVVGVPVIARIVDLPFEYGLLRSINYYSGAPQPSVVMRVQWPPQFPDSETVDRVPRFFSGEPLGRSVRSVSELARRECRPASPPLFDMIVEEFWPDTAEHRAVINDLFGDDALDWWNDLDLPERKRLTAARGLRWWDDLGTGTERNEEREHRSDSLVSRIECRELLSSHEDPSPRTEPSCVWVPERPGYYRAVGVGGWPLAIAEAARGWGGWSNPAGYGRSFEGFVALAQQYVDDVLATTQERALFQLHSNNLPYIELRRLVFGNSTYYDIRDLWRIFKEEPITTGRELLIYILRETFGLTPDQAGLVDTGDALTIRDPGASTFHDDWLYSEDARGLTGCPQALDLRVWCGTRIAFGGGSYTETEAVGIVVHEVRTVTRPAVVGP